MFSPQQDQGRDGTRPPIEYACLDEIPSRITILTRIDPHVEKDWPRWVERWVERDSGLLPLIIGGMKSRLDRYRFDGLVSVDASGSRIAAMLETSFWADRYYPKLWRVEKYEAGKAKQGRVVHRSYHYRNKDRLVIPWGPGDLSGKVILEIEDDFITGGTQEAVVGDAVETGGASSVVVAVMLGWHDLHRVTSIAGRRIVFDVGDVGSALRNPTILPVIVGATVLVTKDLDVDLKVILDYSVSFCIAS